MTWDDQHDRDTKPDGNTPRGRSAIAQRIMRIESDLARVRTRVTVLEDWLRGAALVALIVATLLISMYVTKGSPR